MCAFDGGYDAFHTCQFISCIDSLVVVDGKYFLTSFCSQVGMHGSDAGIVESGGDGKSLFDLSVVSLHDECAGAVQNAFRTAMDRGGGIVGVNAMSTGLCEDDLYAGIVNIMVDRAGCIGAAADTGNKVVGVVAPDLFLQLHLISSEMTLCILATMSG